jgi:PEGA domain
MRYKTLEEVAGKYGLTVDLDERAQLAEWESRLKNLLHTKQKELPNARNPSLRHKVERECAEVQEAYKFVSQHNFFTKLRRCVDEDKQEIFEHELRKPDSLSMLPSENDPDYEQYLELKVAARKKWPNGPVQAAAVNRTVSSLSPSDGELVRGEGLARPPELTPVSKPVAMSIAQATSSITEPGCSTIGAATPLAPVGEPSRPAGIGSAGALIAATTELITFAARTGLRALDSDLSKKQEKTLPAAAESALPSVTVATATGGSAGTVTEQTATTLSQTAATSAATAQAVDEQQTETTTSKPDAVKHRPRIPIKREHVSTALDILVKIRALTSLGGSFTTFKIVGTALAVFLIAVAGLITELTRERSRQNERADNAQQAPAREESRVIPTGSPSPEPSKQPSETIKPSSDFPSVTSENASPTSEPPKPPPEIAQQSTEPAKQPSEPQKQSSNAAKQSSEIVNQPSEPAKQPSEIAKQPSEPASQPSEPAKQPSEPVKQSPEPLKQPGEIAKQSAESTEAQKQPSEVPNHSTEPTKQPSDVAKQSAEPPKPSSDAPQPPPQIAKQLSEPAKQLSEIPKAPVETSTPVVTAKPKESPLPEPLPETKAAPPPRPKIKLALLRIESSPPDAAITIRGTKQPLKTPAEFNLMPGDYDIALALDCYTPVSTTLHLDGGENRVLTRQLQSLQPVLKVRTLPPGAKIYVDGALRNQLTPATVTGIDPGDRWVTVELPGYRSQNMAVKAKCGETVPVDFGILERPTARVSITSNARGAFVWIDGSDSGQVTPCSVELPLGAHRVRLVGPNGYRPEEKSFFLQDEDSVRLDVPLTPELVAIPANNTSPSRPEPPPEYIPRANPNLLVWCGLDYSMVRMIGASRDFPESEIFPSPADRRGDRGQPMTSAWNELFMKEMFPRLSRELGAIVQADLRAVETRNARVTSQQIVNEDSSPRNTGNIADLGSFFDPTRLLHRGNKNLPTNISDADIAAAIRSYRLQTRSGLGLVFFMDRLVKRQETSCMYVVFFDIASRRIVSQERVCTDAGGGGIRNHWFGSIKETVKRLPDMYHDARLKR